MRAIVTLILMLTPLFPIMAQETDSAQMTPEQRQAIQDARARWIVKIWENSIARELLTECAPVELYVSGPGSGAEDIKLTIERIQTTVESRLRGARIYEEGAAHHLHVNVTVVGKAFGIGMLFRKPVIDATAATVLYESLVHGVDGVPDWSRLAEMEILASTWYSGSTGTHGRDAGYILQFVAEKTDEFINEYLRANDHDC